MVATLSFDIEEFDFPLERGREIDFGTQLDVSTGGLEALLDLLGRMGVAATFYVTANYAMHRPEMVRAIVAGGHELASHDYYHRAGSEPDPAGARRVLEEIGGVPVVGYRAPRLGRMTDAELLAAGYHYNSSLNPTFIPGRYNNLRKPRTVFVSNGLTHYPASVSWPFRVPLFWLAFHVFGERFYHSLARSAMRKDGHLNLYFHPWEFSDRLTEPGFGVPGYIARCSGSRLVAKLERLILFLKREGAGFRTTKDYLKING